MSEWYDSQKEPSSNFRKLLQERIAKANPRRTLTAEEHRRLSKIEAPYHGGYHTDWEIWQEDYIRWSGSVNFALKYDDDYIYTLDRVTGILSSDHKSFIRVVKNGHYQKDANGKWVGDQQNHVTATYQCKKEDRLF
jgi:hypothetical protein